MRVAALGVFSFVCGATLLLLAGPASAHASLIGASPAPGATLAAAPPTIELDFDSPVETVFDAVHVYDVHAKRVDANNVDLTNHHDSVLVHMAGRGSGTFTVVWKVISSDGHVTDGRYQYYVGRPSKQSSAVIPVASGPSTFVTVLAWLSRFAWYLALALLGGVLVVWWWIWTPALAAVDLDGVDLDPDRDPRHPTPIARSLGAAVSRETLEPREAHPTARRQPWAEPPSRPDTSPATYAPEGDGPTTHADDDLVPDARPRSSPADEAFAASAETALRWIWPALALASVFVLWTEAAIASGGSLWSAAHPSVVRELLGTDFGTAWKLQAIAVLALALPVLVVVQRRPRLGIDPYRAGPLAVALVFLGSVGTALSGHARQSAHPLITVLAAALHVGAAVVWVGGLVALAVLAVPAWAHVAPAARRRLVAVLVRNFGVLALGAVVVLAISGIVLGFAELAHMSDLWHTTYGRVLAVKIVLFVIALGFAAWHRVIATRELEDGASGGVTRFELTSLVESSVLVAVLVIAAVLVALVPGRAIAARAQGPADGIVRVGTYRAAVAIAPAVIGASEVHLTFTDRKGDPAAAVTRPTVTLRAADGTTRTVTMQRLSPGHFSGDVQLRGAGRDRLGIAIPAAGANASATFSFTVHAASAPAS